MEKRIKSLEEVRRHSPVSSNANTQIKHLTELLSSRRIGMIEQVEKFMFIGGIEQPVSSVLDIFNDYLQLCGYLEDLADKADAKKESEESKVLAETIREEYLPSFGRLSDRFYDIKELLNFIIRVGGDASSAAHYERKINAMIDIITPEQSV